MESRHGYAGSAYAFANAPIRTRPSQLPLLLAALLAFGAFRIATLAMNGTDLYMDEAQYWAWAQAPAFGYYSKPPLLAWIIHGTTAVCGDGEFCVRLPATLLHLVTALLVYAIGARLYSFDVGLLSGLAYALLPAVSLSSGIISTDVPLLAAWALALYAFARLVAEPCWATCFVLAVALGLGLNAKYAMAYFIVCAAVYFAVAPEARRRLREPHIWLALAGGVALLIPNVLWNIANDFATVAHTADNANWRGVPFHPGKAAEFLLSQFGVFGPILFGALLVIATRAARAPANVAAPDRLLLAFSLPILLLVTTQALLSRAHANWAAPAYVAAVVLVTAVMVRDRAWIWMRASFAVHGLVAIALAIATWQAGRFSLPIVGDPFARTLGNRELADAARTELEAADKSGRPYRSIVSDWRDGAATLAYYARDVSVPGYAWRASERPQSHFELSHPFDDKAPRPALFISENATPSAIARYPSAVPVGARRFEAGSFTARTVHFFRIEGSERP